MCISSVKFRLPYVCLWFVCLSGCIGFHVSVFVFLVFSLVLCVFVRSYFFLLIVFSYKFVELLGCFVWWFVCFFVSFSDGRTNCSEMFIDKFDSRRAHETHSEKLRCSSHDMLMQLCIRSSWRAGVSVCCWHTCAMCYGLSRLWKRECCAVSRLRMTLETCSVSDRLRHGRVDEY